MIESNKLLVADSWDSAGEYQSPSTFELSDPYIRWLSMNFAIEDEGGSLSVSIYGEAEKASRLGRLDGALILGAQADRELVDIVTACDDCSADLGEAAFRLKKEDVLCDEVGFGRDVLYVHELELDDSLSDDDVAYLVDELPRIVFQLFNVMPQVVCYLRAGDGYYESCDAKTDGDSRARDEWLTGLLCDSGYRVDESGSLLYQVADGAFAWDTVTSDENEEDGPSCSPCHASGAEKTSVLTGEKSIVDQVNVQSTCDLLEDYLAIGFGPSIVLVRRSAPDDFVKSLQAAIVSHNMGMSFDHALDRIDTEEEPDVPEVHDAFQALYFAGKQHMEKTRERMDSKHDPNAAEIFADAALSRAINTYYVAGLLYREGHMIEANAMSRLMLEQMAWAFAAQAVDPVDDIKKLKPTKAVGILGKHVPGLGRLYGALSDYVHLPFEGHYQFVNVSSGENSVMTHFGAHSYAFGAVLARLADCWACVYEYTQARHFEELENWTEDSGSLTLNPSRPFLEQAVSLHDRLMDIYERDYIPFSDDIKLVWNIDDSTDDDTSKC